MEAPGSRSDPRWLTPRDQKAVQFFRAAAEEFAKAESMDPTLLEAPLHQGRSWLLAGESARAIAPLERAARSADLPVRYLSVMLLGAIDEGADRFEIAESRYRSAIAIAPFAQSAPLALAQLMTRQGRGTEARAVVAAHFQRTDWQVAEPLWNYLAAPSGHLTEALQNLRAEVWR
jgi:Flp pilus assembly protein TadD